MIVNPRTPNQIKSLFRLIDSKTNQRYSNQKLPAYRHIPGLTPHPISDEKGHSYGVIKDKIGFLTENNWYTNEEYFYAIDLFNHAYYWEAHESLEDFWMKAKNLHFKLFLQGIIQISAAYLKWVQGFSEGMKKLQIKGLLKLKKIMNSSPVLFGINIIDFINKCEEFFNSKDNSNLIPPLIILQGL